MYKLIIEDDEGKTTVVPLIRDEITIGRKEGNTIRLTERNVSRRHAKLAKSNAAIYIEDLSSYNGIRVNGDRIAGRAPVTESDRIQIGDYQLALKLDKSAAAEPAEDAGDGKTTPFVKDGKGDLKEEPTRATADAPTRASPIIAGPVETAERPAKLVVVSSNFAGKEWKLDKAQNVIGRTDENDVVINHRSISRHHAKIVREQGRYQVVDLGSANGVRVNGEDYGKVELRKGDLIDLGHVRLRFVAPNEDFVFARDAQVVDVATTEKKGPPWLIIGAAIALLVLLIGGLVAWKSRGPDTGKPGTDSSDKVAPMIVEADRCLGTADWDCVIAQAQKGLAIDPNNSALREKKAKAESEKKAKDIYDQYTRAAKASDYDTAVARYQELPESSSYHDKAQETWPLIKNAYVKNHLDKARNFQTGGNCDAAKQEVQSVLTVDDNNREAMDLAAKCGQVVAPLRPKTPTAPPQREPKGPRPARPVDTHPSEPIVRNTPAPETPKPTPPPEPKPVAPAAGGGELLVSAQDCYVHGDYQCAIDKAHKELKEDPGNTKAWRLIGASNCFLKDKPGATAAWNKLGNIERQFLKYVCQRNGITLP